MCGLRAIRGVMKLWADYRWAYFFRVVLLLSLASPMFTGFCMSILQYLMSYPCGAFGTPGDCPMPTTCDVNDATLNWQGNKDFSIVYAWKLDLCNNNSFIVSQIGYLMMLASWVMTGIFMFPLRPLINQKQALTLSLALTALFALLSTLVAKYSLFVLLQALFGLAFGSGYVVPVFLVMDLARADKEDDGRVMGVTGRLWLAGGMLMSTIFFFCLGVLKLGNLCASLASDWKELYLSVAVGALLCCVLVQAFLPESHEIIATLEHVAKSKKEYLLLS